MGLSEKWAFPILNWIQRSSEDTIPKHLEEKSNIQKTIYMLQNTQIWGLILQENGRVTERFCDIFEFPPGVLMSWESSLSWGI